MQIIRLIADTIKGGIFVPFVRYPATEDDKTDVLLDYGKWSSNPSYNNWRIELCNGEIVDDEVIVSSVIKTWSINM